MLRLTKAISAPEPTPNMWVVVEIMGPFLGALNIRCRIIIGIPKRDHNFDNHPDMCFEKLIGLALGGLIASTNS